MQIMKKRIAVCLYGQPRTWRYCAPYISKFYNLPDVDVDYFVSVKTYQMTGEYRDNSVIELTNAEISDLLQTYNPKKYSIIQYSDELEKHVDVTNYSNIYYGMIDSIMLKQQYEAENFVFYDFVFLQRYDTIVQPISLLELFFNTDLSQVCKNNNTLYYLSDNGTVSSIFVPNGINEIWLGGAGTVLDILSFELINYVSGLSLENLYANKTITPIFSDPHCLMYQLAIKNTINLEKWNNVVNSVDIQSSIIRSNCDLTLDVFDPNSIAKHYQHYLETGYNKKLQHE